MKKFFFCVSLVLTGLMTSCVDKYEEVDADSKPSWLGSSIYAELKNPDGNAKLSGTFNNYLRLIDDLGYAETLSRTGSKTVFPANDEAFTRFFATTNWKKGDGSYVRSYEDLSMAQRKMLLYSSMLDNALLLGMLPNASNETANPLRGYALKHETNMHLIDTVQYISGKADMPQNNPYWEKFYDKGIHVVRDATLPMMVHLTREYMLTNNISTLGDESDFAIITGTPYTEGTAYVFNYRVISGDVTCQNGYIHQMEDVVVPPGNMAQVLHDKERTKYFSHILDYFAVPFYSKSTTDAYNEWATANGMAPIDSIYQVRYYSGRSNQSSASSDAALQTDPNDKPVTSLLSFDPGWNQYYPKMSNAGGAHAEIMDMGAFFVPEDAAVEKYFLPGGGGAYLIDIYGKKENTQANLMENLDSLHNANPAVLKDFVNNLLQPKFTSTVPSKFPNVPNDASEVLGVTVDMLQYREDDNTKRDITIANNGVIYLLNEVIAPDEYQSVMAPTKVYPDMMVMRWAVEDGVANGDYLGVDYSYYLKAMKANYGFFIPEDNAFSLFYVDPASLGHLDPNDPAATLPDVLYFYYDPASKTKPNLKCARYYWNPVTGMPFGSPRPADIKEVKNQLVDILNFHTLVMDEGEVIGDNHFYKTKHGGEVYVDGSIENGRVVSGEQYEGNPLFPAPRIKTVYNEKNGKAYRMDRIVQGPHRSVFATLNQDEALTRAGVLNEESVFYEFLKACNGFSQSNLLAWAGISVDPEQEGMPSPQDAYRVFTRNYKVGSKETKNACLDYNVQMFKTFNYTLFAPDNTAMAKAYAEGLPRWEDIQALYEKYNPSDDSEPIGGPEDEDKETAKAAINAIRNFVRYHFMTNSVYADNTLDGGRYQTLSSDSKGVAKEVRLSGGNGQIVVTDANGHTVTVDASNSGKMVNKMTRDFWFNADKTAATTFETSSFCAVHQISEPLYNDNTGSFNH